MICGAVNGMFTCTRELGHTGDHQDRSGNTGGLVGWRSEGAENRAFRAGSEKAPPSISEFFTSRDQPRRML